MFLDTVCALIFEYDTKSTGNKDRNRQMKLYWTKKAFGEGNGNPLQYSCLENPMERRAWRATIHRIMKGRTWLKWLNTKCFCTANETINRVKKQPREWEKIFPNYINGKGLIQIYIRNSYNSIPIRSSQKKKPYLKNEWRTWIDISTKKTYKWPSILNHLRNAS